MSSIDLNQQSPYQARFAITQLQFKSKTYETSPPKGKEGFTPTFSLQNTSRHFVIRTQHRQKRMQEGNNELFGILQLRNSEPKNNMFMAWKERSSSQVKVQSNSSKLLKEVMANMRRSLSERKVASVPYDLQARRLTAIPKQRFEIMDEGKQLPMEIMAHKLQCVDKIGRKINPNAHIRRNESRKQEIYGKDANNLMRLSGWDGENGQASFERQIYL